MSDEPLSDDDRVPEPPLNSTETPSRRRSANSHRDPGSLRRHGHREAAEKSNGMRLASAGFELATFGLIMGAAGYGIDSWMGNETPYVGIAGLLTGSSLGFYRLIALANRISP